MKDALLRYYEEVLKPKGYSDPIIKGSVISLARDGNVFVFSAEDA